MGIYPTITYRKQPDGALHQIVDEPGLKTVYVYQPVATFQFRDNCFCCSCPEPGVGGDPYCRNHGFAGTRPCEVHGMPGEADEDGEMPPSVQEMRRLRESQGRWLEERPEIVATPTRVVDAEGQQVTDLPPGTYEVARTEKLDTVQLTEEGDNDELHPGEVF